MSEKTDGARTGHSKLETVKRSGRRLRALIGAGLVPNRGEEEIEQEGVELDIMPRFDSRARDRHLSVG